MRRKLNGFTLSETLIVVVVLGIIATLTIPTLVNKNKESVAKTKVRKAMAAYESALNKMVIENDLKDNTPLITWAGNADNNCANSTNYFKKVQGDGCIFKTSDGIWWNISDIERPVISFKEINADNAATITANANNANDKTAFVLVGRFGNDGSLRVDDLAYETTGNNADQNSDTQVKKLYSFLGLYKDNNAGGGNQSPFAACNGADTCVVNGIEYKKMTLTAESATYDYCDPEDWIGDPYWNCGEDGYKWQIKTSESKAGEYYIALEGLPDDYNTQAFNYEGSTCQLCQDEETGDYYNAAKRHCETSGGRLATIVELKSLQSQGKLPSTYSWFWASEEDGPYYAYYVNTDGDVNYDGKDRNDFQVLCLGQ